MPKSKKSKSRRLMKHQLRALKFIRGHTGQAGSFMAPGTGKTLTSIRYVKGEQHQLALVVCRRDDFMTWEQELEMERQREPFIIDSGRVDLGEATEFCMGDGKCRWILTTYDLMKNPEIGEWVEGELFDIVIADESHMIKRWKSSRTKAVIRRTRHIPERIAMTGSPITNEPLDVFSQCLFIDDGKTFGSNEWAFKRKYYLKSGPGWYKRRGAKDEIAERLKKIAFYVHEDDAMKLPPKKSIIKGAPMSKSQAKSYQQVLDEWEILIGEDVLEIDQVIVQLAKMKQIASGFIYDQEGKPHWMKSEKMNLLFDLLEDKDYMGSKPKVVIWASYTAEIEKIAEIARKNKIKCVTFSGSNRKKKEAARRQFRDNKRTRLFIGQVDSGVGMNELIVADTAVYFSNSFKVVSRQQSMRRIRRRGSERHKRITYYDLITEKSVDRHVLQSINNNMGFASMILSKIRQSKNVSGFLR